MKQFFAAILTVIITVVLSLATSLESRIIIFPMYIVLVFIGLWWLDGDEGRNRVEEFLSGGRVTTPLKFSEGGDNMNMEIAKELAEQMAYDLGKETAVCKAHLEAFTLDEGCLKCREDLLEYEETCRKHKTSFPVYGYCPPCEDESEADWTSGCFGIPARPTDEDSPF